MFFDEDIEPRQAIQANFLGQLIKKLKEIFKSDFGYCLFADCIEYEHKKTIGKISKACMAEDGTLYVMCSHEDVAHSEV